MPEGQPDDSTSWSLHDAAHHMLEVLWAFSCSVLPWPAMHTRILADPGCQCLHVASGL